ncbi:protein D3-like [Spodoptera frugiperda]|uniref:Protein D3-like n=1 Tax=Spodoptera frugiperda TaxID=7108 RepID=A0A9R0EX21_SPOFR|nr:protein D3-like [Spodoptera frugiperda]
MKWCCVVLLAFANNFAKANVTYSFISNELVPDVIPVAPSDRADVLFEMNNNFVRTGEGNVLTPSEVRNPPIWVLWSYTTAKYYTLMMIDPDAPTRQAPTYRSWLHWLVVNIPGIYIPNRGDTLVEYVGAGPPNGTGLHRYVFLVYEQPGLMEFTGAPVSSNRTSANRVSFSAVDFAKKFNLEDPIAGDFFQAQYDDYVPILHRQLKGEVTEDSPPAAAAASTMFNLNLILFLSCIMFIFKAIN